MAAVDPGALYNETLGNLKLTETQTLGKLGEEEGNLTSNYGTINPATGYAEGGIVGNELTRQEPITYTAEANRANKGGILNSGSNTTRKTNIANTFAGKRIANAAKLTQGLGAIKRGRENIKDTTTSGERKAAAELAVNQDAYNAANPTVGPAAAPNSGGIVPREYGRQPGTPAVAGQPWVRINGPGPIKWSRDPKVREEQARRGY